MTEGQGPRRLRERWPDLLVAAAIGLELVHAWYTRYAFNPDGVSYLDLVGRLRAGDFASFVQGYWSPAFPFLVAMGSVATGGAPLTMLMVAHAVSAAAIIAAILLLRAWGRRLERPYFTAAAVLALLLVSDGLPKLETVSPDILALACMVWVGYELLALQGTRWVHTGLALGLLFLIRSSSWIWILLAVPLRLWAASAGWERRLVVRSSLLSLLIALFWIVPLSVRSGKVTIGSTARFNYCWYLLGCDSRTPDTHLGEHLAYRTATLDDTQVLGYAEYATADRWTYAPWSDPTAWQAGVVTQRVNPYPGASLPGFWRHQARLVFLDWLVPVALMVALPWAILGWKPGTGPWLFADGRIVLVAGALGVAGVVQFVVVHAEPRLIAPFALLSVLALLHARGREPATDQGRLAMLRPWVIAAGVAVAGMYGYFGIEVARQGHQRSEVLLRGIAATQARYAAAGAPSSPVVVVGPAIPAVAAAYLAGVRIAAQVRPASVAPLLARPQAEQFRILSELFARRAPVAWFTTMRGDVNVMRLGPGRDSTGSGSHP